MAQLITCLVKTMSLAFVTTTQTNNNNNNPMQVH